MITEAWLPEELSDAVTAGAPSRAPLCQHESTTEIAWPRGAKLLNTAIGSALVRLDRLALADGEQNHYLSILLSPNRSRAMLSPSAAELEAGGGMSGFSSKDLRAMR